MDTTAVLGRVAALVPIATSICWWVLLGSLARSQYRTRTLGVHQGKWAAGGEGQADTSRGPCCSTRTSSAPPVRDDAERQVENGCVGVALVVDVVRMRDSLRVQRPWVTRLFVVFQLPWCGWLKLWTNQLQRSATGVGRSCESSSFVESVEWEHFLN